LRHARTALGALLVAAVGAPAAAHAQRAGVEAVAATRGATPVAVVPQAPAIGLLRGGLPVGVASEPLAPSSRAMHLPAAPAEPRWWIPFASMVLPGAGQALLSQDRFVAYVALEGYAWLRYGADVGEGRRQRAAYRALAARVARRFYPDPRPVGDFEYYEQMEHYIESGVFDLFPGGALEPETDTLTFNGAMWLLARRTYWADPDAAPPTDSPTYASALEFYQRRAVTPEFRWSWRNAQLEQDLFRRTIARSNDAFRRSIQDLGIVIANHALSTVDAYVTLRLRHRAAPDDGLEMSASLPWAPFGRPSP
jgi:hypothetical protein